jgi:hypothetical protein
MEKINLRIADESITMKFGQKSLKKSMETKSRTVLKEMY